MYLVIKTGSYDASYVTGTNVGQHVADLVFEILGKALNFTPDESEKDADGYYNTAFGNHIVNYKTYVIDYSVKELPEWQVNERSYQETMASQPAYHPRLLANPINDTSIFVSLGHTSLPTSNFTNPDTHCELFIKPGTNLNNVDHAKPALVPYGTSDNNFVRPRLYSAGGYLYITISKSHFLIASSNINKCSWTPGLGIVNYKPSILDYYGVQFGSYNKKGTYPTWVFFSMNGISNISAVSIFNIHTNKDDNTAEEDNQTQYVNGALQYMYPTPYPAGANKNLFQLKSPYLNQVLSPTGMNIPKKTMNYNYISAMVGARVCICNKLTTANDNQDNYNPDHYDNGGDISEVCPIYMVGSGKSLNEIEVVLPHQDKVDMTNPDDKKQYDEKRWGKYIIWDSMVSSNKTLETKSTFKYIVWYG
jgi:hypothetical protein